MINRAWMRHTVGMLSLNSRGSRPAAAALLVTLGLTLAACSSSGGGSGGSGTPTSQPSSPVTSAASSTPPSGAEPTTGSGAIAAIEANWATFFNAKTPLAKRLSLLQGGSAFESVIKAQAGTGLAAEAGSKVTHVSLTGTDQAAVTYDILVGGQPALSNKSGVAVYEDGVWKVGTASFCALLKLEGAKVAACKG